MNCKPGDLAVIVRVYADDWDGVVGKIFRLTTLGNHGWGYRGPTWGYEGPRLVHPRFGEYMGFADDCLCPIRPGDISDEEVRGLYAPKLPERESA